MINYRSKAASLSLAAALHVLPLAARLSQTGLGLAKSPIAIVMTWLVRIALIEGAHHAVSAASAALVSAKTVSGTQGTRLSYQIRINDGENRTPESWRINGTLFSRSGSTTLGMPPGLSLSLSTGIISGTPTQGGSFPTTITAYEHPNGGGAALTFTVTFNITAITQPTTIATQPANASLHTGESLNLSVSASGTAPFTYAWQKDGVDIPGASDATFSVAAVDAGAAGAYTVQVTGAGGSATSSAATVTVTPLRFISLTHAQGATILKLTTIPNRHYILESTPSLNPFNWMQVGEVTATTAETEYQDSVSTGSEMIWRYFPLP